MREIQVSVPLFHRGGDRGTERFSERSKHTAQESDTGELTPWGQLQGLSPNLHRGASVSAQGSDGAI